MNKVCRDSALLIQRTWRGYNAVRHVQRRKTFDTMRSAALLAVDPSSLYLCHVTEMRDRIRRAVDRDGSAGNQSALLTGSEASLSQRYPLPYQQTVTSCDSDRAREYGDFTSYPPDEVLQLLRLVLIIIQGDRPLGALGTTSYSPSGGRTFDGLDPRNISWTQAYKVRIDDRLSMEAMEKCVRQLSLML